MLAPIFSRAQHSRHSQPVTTFPATLPHPTCPPTSVSMASSSSTWGLPAEFNADGSVATARALTSAHYARLTAYVCHTISDDDLRILSSEASRGGLTRNLPDANEFKYRERVLTLSGRIVLPWEDRLEAVYRAAVEVYLLRPGRVDGLLSVDDVWSTLEEMKLLRLDAGQRSVFGIPKSLVEVCLWQGDIKCASVHHAMRRLAELTSERMSNSVVKDLPWRSTFPFVPASLPSFFNSLQYLPGRLDGKVDGASGESGAERGGGGSASAQTSASGGGGGSSASAQTSASGGGGGSSAGGAVSVIRIAVGSSYLPCVLDGIGVILGGEFGVHQHHLQMGVRGSGSISMPYHCRHSTHFHRNGCAASFTVEISPDSISSRFPEYGGAFGSNPHAIIHVFSAHTTPCPYSQTREHTFFDSALALTPAAQGALLRGANCSQEELFMNASYESDKELSYLTEMRLRLRHTGAIFGQGIGWANARARRAHMPSPSASLFKEEEVPLCLCGQLASSAPLGTEWVQCSFESKCKGVRDGWYHLKCLNRVNIAADWTCAHCTQNLPAVLIRSGSAYVAALPETERTNSCIIVGRAALSIPGWNTPIIGAPAAVVPASTTASAVGGGASGSLYALPAKRAPAAGAIKMPNLQPSAPLLHQLFLIVPPQLSTFEPSPLIGIS